MAKNLKPINLLDGHLPPQAVELEKTVLGALMLESEAFYEIAEHFKPELFYKQEHVSIANAILTLIQKSQPVDILTVTQQLKRTGELENVGGAFYVAQLTNNVASSANIKAHTLIIVQEYIKRQIIAGANIMLRDAYDKTSDCFDVIDTAERSISQLSNQIVTNKIDSVASLYNQFMKVNETIKKSTDGINGVESGFLDIDKVTGGWQKSDLIIIAGRPSMGKTALMMSMARNAAVTHKRKIGVFSLEMSKLQLMSRLMAQETGWNSQKYTRHGLTEDEIIANESKCRNLINSSMYIDDTPSMTVFEMRNKARKLKRDFGIEALFIDYLQISRSGQKGLVTEQEISAISSGFKALAKELNIPVIALSQLSRSVENRGGAKIPTLSDLRGSGSIEQDADIVMFVHRDEYYGIYEDANGNSTRGRAAVIIAKNRNGALDTAVLNFEAKTTKFYDDNQIDSSIETNNSLQSNYEFLDEQF